MENKFMINVKLFRRLGIIFGILLNFSNEGKWIYIIFIFFFNNRKKLNKLHLPWNFWNDIALFIHED
jgi:hypothetical protein